MVAKSFKLLSIVVTKLLVHSFHQRKTIKDGGSWQNPTTCGGIRSHITFSEIIIKLNYLSVRPSRIGQILLFREKKQTSRKGRLSDLERRTNNPRFFLPRYYVRRPVHHITTIIYSQTSWSDSTRIICASNLLILMIALLMLKPDEISIWIWYFPPFLFLPSFFYLFKISARAGLTVFSDFRDSLKDLHPW